MMVNDDFNSVLPKDIVRYLNITSARIASFRHADFMTKELYAPSTHLLKGSGKMLRPALVFLGAQAIGAKGGDLIDLAAAAELLHVSSLVHDDIIDEGKARRGMKAVNAEYGSNIALLAGDALIAKAILLSSRYGKRVMDKVAGAALHMCAGELMDYRLQKSGKADVKDCLKIAALKTASLTGVSCSMAASYMDNRWRDALHGYGFSLGMAFQIRDDVLDFIDPEGDCSSGAKSGSNIVTAIGRDEGMDGEEALKKAAALNRRYVKQAVGKINGKMLEFLEPYARAVEIGY